MAYGGYDYEFIDLLPDECPCAVCTLVQKEPYQVTCCGKIFCKSCLDQLILKKNNCPNCRSNILNYKYKRNFHDVNMERKIKHLKIYCVNKKNGCEWTGQLKDLEQTHIHECPNKNVLCKNDGCSALVQRHQLVNHMKTNCEYRRATCIHCGLEDTRFIITGRHTRTCPDMIIDCINEGCEVCLKRKLLQEHVRTCPKSPVRCQYSSVGCTTLLTRENVKTHNRRYMDEHLNKAVTKLQHVMKQLEDATKQLEDVTIRLEALEHKRFPPRLEYDYDYEDDEDEDDGYYNPRRH